MLKKFLVFFNVYGCLLACMLVYHVNVIPGEVEEGITPPGTGVLDSCGLTCGCWGIKP